MLKFMARGFLSVLVVVSLLIVAAGPSMAIDSSMDHSASPIITNIMDCPACVPVAHSAGNSVCVQLPCFNLAEATAIVSLTIDYRIAFAVEFSQLPEGLEFKPPTPPV